MDEFMILCPVSRDSSGAAKACYGFNHTQLNHSLHADLPHALYKKGQTDHAKRLLLQSMSMMSESHCAFQLHD